MTGFSFELIEDSWSASSWQSLKNSDVDVNFNQPPSSLRVKTSTRVPSLLDVGAKTVRVRSTQFESVDSKIISSERSLEKEVDMRAGYVFIQLKEERFSSGELSVVDFEVEKLLKEKGSDFTLKLMNNLALKCYSLKSETAYSHYLNVLKNLSFHINDAILRSNILVALSHRDTSIKEAAIAIFEGWNYQSKDELDETIGILENVDTNHIGWLDEYRMMVLEDLQSDREENYK